MERRSLLLWFVAGTALSACSHAQGPAGPSGATIERRSATEWVVRVRRERNGKSATGEVVLLQKPAGDPPPHLTLAGARAWLALGELLLSGKDYPGAVACAQAGLDELGPNYAPPEAFDDTQLNILGAKDRIKQGQMEYGARVMLQMLKTRTRLYVRKNQRRISSS